jgi:aminoglycoside phosphotransferase family enzyme/predicted kinase
MAAQVVEVSQVSPCGAFPGAKAGAGWGGAPEGEPFADALESHLSVVVLIGGHALKVKKAVRLPFVDLSTTSARREVCLAELDLNRRLTPDVYLGVAELGAPWLSAPSDAGSPGLAPLAGEPVLVMRRLPRSRRLSALLRTAEDLRPVLTDVARQLVCLHEAQRQVYDHDLLGSTTRLWHEGAAQLHRFTPDPLDGTDVDRVLALAQEYVVCCAGLLQDRERRGLVRDGHGDLLGDDIFCLPDGARILDCLEFDRDLRVNDVLADVAFLAMDLELRGAPHLARHFLDRYREFGDEVHPRSLEHHYIAYRAFVRAKVECLLHEQGDPDAAARARRLLELTLRHAGAARIHLVLVGGLPGSGKSTLAAGLASRDAGREWSLVSSDAVRRDLFGGVRSAGPQPPYAGHYDPEHTAAVYDEMLHRAALALAAGTSVVMDASWSDHDRRLKTTALARRVGAVHTQVRCEASEATCARRLVGRPDPHGSDADPEILRAMAERADRWPDAVGVRTDGSVAAAVSALQELLARRPVDLTGTRAVEVTGDLAG